MPKINWEEKNKVDKLIGKHLENNPLYQLSEIFEIVKLNIDETGVKL